MNGNLDQSTQPVTTVDVQSLNKIDISSPSNLGNYTFLFFFLILLYCRKLTPLEYDLGLSHLIILFSLYIFSIFSIYSIETLRLASFQRKDPIFIGKKEYLFRKVLRDYIEMFY